MPQTGDTKTHVMGTPEQVTKFANELLSACRRLPSLQETQHVRATFEQVKFDGPWEVVISIPYREDSNVITLRR